MRIVMKTNTPCVCISSSKDTDCLLMARLRLFQESSGGQPQVLGGTPFLRHSPGFLVPVIPTWPPGLVKHLVDLILEMRLKLIQLHHLE